MKEKTISSYKVTIIPPATPTRPIDGRTYRLHYSEDRKEWNLSIGYEYEEKENFNHGHQYMAKWNFHRGRYILVVFVKNVPSGSREKAKQSMKNELYKFFQGIVRGDETFFHHFPWVWDAPIYVTYGKSKQPLMETEQIGTPRHFMYNPQEESLTIL